MLQNKIAVPEVKGNKTLCLKQQMLKVNSETIEINIEQLRKSTGSSAENQVWARRTPSTDFINSMILKSQETNIDIKTKNKVKKQKQSS